MSDLRDVDDAEAAAKMRETAVPRAPRAPAPARPPTRRVEFALPVAVAVRIGTEAAERGTTATRVVLEALRRAGYPVAEADLADARKGRRA